MYSGYVLNPKFTFCWGGCLLAVLAGGILGAVDGVLGGPVGGALGGGEGYDTKKTKTLYSDLPSSCNQDHWI